MKKKVRLSRRYHLRDRRVKQILDEISKNLKLAISDFADERTSIEAAELIPKGEIILMDNKAAFIQLEDEVFPTLLNEAVLAKLPSITVDMGAIPHICNGADLMAPGIVKIDGDFEVGDVLTIVEERFSKRVAVAKALCNSIEADQRKRGKVAINLHFVGDYFWEAFKLL